MTLRLIDAPSPNFNDRLHKLNMLVLHYTGMKDGPSALARMRDEASQVSAHYMVEEDGRVFGLVPEDKRAWQAGRSWWQGDDDLNSRSIGIEIVNPGHEWGYRPFPDPQIAAVIELCQGILSRWPIPQNRIVAHSDIAPDRKEDPGELFPWQRFAAAGVGIWPAKAEAGEAAGPGDTGAEVARLQRDLSDIGYRIDPSGAYDEAMAAVIRAFQRRWRQSAVDGVADEETAGLIAAVAKLSA